MAAASPPAACSRHGPIQGRGLRGARSQRDMPTWARRDQGQARADRVRISGPEPRRCLPEHAQQGCSEAPPQQHKALTSNGVCPARVAWAARYPSTNTRSFLARLLPADTASSCHVLTLTLTSGWHDLSLGLRTAEVAAGLCHYQKAKLSGPGTLQRTSCQWVLQ